MLVADIARLITREDETCCEDRAAKWNVLTANWEEDAKRKCSRFSRSVVEEVPLLCCVSNTRDLTSTETY